jgi:hypothetical protein
LAAVASRKETELGLNSTPRPHPTAQSPLSSKLSWPALCSDVEIDARGRVHVSAKVAEDLIALGLRVWLSLMPFESTNALRNKLA